MGQLKGGPEFPSSRQGGVVPVITTQTLTLSGPATALSRPSRSTRKVWAGRKVSGDSMFHLSITLKWNDTETRKNSENN